MSSPRSKASSSRSQGSAPTLQQEDEQAPKLARDAKALRCDDLISVDSENEHGMVEIRTGCRIMNPTTGRGKKLHLIQMLLLPFIPIMALITQTAISMVGVLKHQQYMQKSIDQIQISIDLGILTEAMQSERAEIAFFLFTNGSVIRRNLSEHFHYTNTLIDDLKWPQFSTDDELFQNKILFRARLDDFRNKIVKFDFDETYSIEASIEFYNKANYIFLDQLTQEIQENGIRRVWRLLLAYKYMIRAIEHLGISMVFGEQYYGRGELDHSSYVKFATNDVLGQEFIDQSQNFVHWIKDRYMVVQDLYPLYSNVIRQRLEILMRKKIKPDFNKATEYFHAMIGYLDALKNIQVELRDRMVKLIMTEMRNSENQVLLDIGVLCVVLIISPIIILLVRMVTRTIQAFSETLLYKTNELKFEKRRTDQLLYQMLPPTAALQLKQGKQVSAVTYESVTIYFSDIVGFTQLAAECTPIQVISLLNALYGMFDSLIDMYDVHKMETIGDVYMVASGVLERSGKDHASEVALMALVLLYGTDNLVIPHMPGERLQIRIGIHTGAVVTGVVGTKVPRYCLFGDSVNIASRMASTGLPFKIHISANTKEALDKCGGFATKLRGETDIKGKGVMQTFWLVGKTGSLYPHPDDPPTHYEDDGIDVTAENPHTVQQRLRSSRSRTQKVNFRAAMSRPFCPSK